MTLACLSCLSLGEYIAECRGEIGGGLATSCCRGCCPGSGCPEVSSEACFGAKAGSSLLQRAADDVAGVRVGEALTKEARGSAEGREATGRGRLGRGGGGGFALAVGLGGVGTFELQQRRGQLVYMCVWDHDKTEKRATYPNAVHAISKFASEF